MSDATLPPRLGAMAMGRMLAGLSTRRYRVGLGPVGAEVEASASSTSRSAVSREFVRATETAPAEPLAASLHELDEDLAAGRLSVVLLAARLVQEGGGRPLVESVNIGPGCSLPKPESTDGLGCAGCRARNGRFGGCGSGWWRWQGATVAVRACGQEETAVGRRSQACWRQAVERSARPSGVRSGAGSPAAGRGRR